MNSLFEKLQLLRFDWKDAIDIIIVAVIIYNVLALIRRTRAMQMAVGLLLLAGAYFVARTFDLVALETISREIFFYLPFAAIVLFQHEIRRALANFGRTPLISFLAPRNGAAEIDPLVTAATELARRRVGALIVVERSDSLRVQIESGKVIDAVVSPELLVSLFAPTTPLHDGAAIIRDGRVAAAGVFLPLSSEDAAVGQHGTRHRAALGMSEETDALVLVVSEENGCISIALDGTLIENLSPDELRRQLLISLTPRREAA